MWDTLERFVDALMRPRRRYVLFLDDLQWAEETTTRVLEALCLRPRRHLLLLLAVNDDELGADHPLTLLLARARSRAAADRARARPAHA